MQNANAKITLTFFCKLNKYFKCHFINIIYNISKYYSSVKDWNISRQSFYNISESIKCLFVSKIISESRSCNVAMNYFSIFNNNVATNFQWQWNIRNIPDIFLQYSVPCEWWSLPTTINKNWTKRWSEKDQNWGTEHTK